VKPLTAHWFLVWWKRASAASTPDSFELAAVDADKLLLVDPVFASKQMRQLGTRFYPLGSEFGAYIFLPEFGHGLHEHRFPEDFRRAGEFLVLDRRRNLHLLIANPLDGNVESCRQSWFNEGGFDRGYQWVTRVVRDPKTRRIVGDGIRLGIFALDSSSQNVTEWILADPSYGPTQQPTY
jgi:hypothetical protein